MIYTTLISPTDLASHLGEENWAIVDCRFSLDNSQSGRQDYLKAHIPGAVYAHLDEDLCGPIIPGKTGRHPLPTINRFVDTLSKWGIDSYVQVVAYDDAGGAMASARLWWMLRWLGHKAAAVLDGGWNHWLEESYPISGGVESRRIRRFTPRIRPEMVIDAREVPKMCAYQQSRVIDVRAAERYRGEIEPIDPVAGHIPGAISAPYTENLEANGLFRTPEALRTRYRQLLGDVTIENVAVYCGSGVTAAQTVLALAYAGLGEAKLYAGSWSEWITDPKRPVAHVTDS